MASGNSTSKRGFASMNIERQREIMRQIGWLFMRRGTPAGSVPSDTACLWTTTASRHVSFPGTLASSRHFSLPGVSPNRAHRLLAGAVVAHEALDILDLDRVDICPWALREGVILRRLDWLAEG